jgi:prepilin-type N-terminal cleavage/methylation domain-containing protein
MRHPPSHRRSGFTFIEMLVVFVVFAAVMAISYKGMGDTLRRNRVAKASLLVGGDLEQAFATAARLRQPVRIVVDAPNKKFTIKDRATPTPVIFKRRTLDSTSTFAVDSLVTSRDSIEIMPNGLADDSLKLTLIMKSLNGSLYTKSIWVSRAGLVKVDNR